MARLNDLPTTLDSIESLKRRFIRQNREIARANSVQSIRIRTLEAEISHLLAENVTLREGIISANHELEQYRSGSHFEKRINTLRERFESGLGELSALVKDLNKLPTQYFDNSASTLKEGNVGKEGETKRISPRSLSRLSEDNAMLEDGSCLPAIPEDRVYAPEIDKEAEEEVALEDDGIEPLQPMDDVELNEEKLEMEAATKERDQPHLPCATKDSTVEAVLEKVRPINTRPKRRDSSLFQTLMSKKDVEVDQDSSPVRTVAGSKRKFDAQECEALPQEKQRKDEFQYTVIKKAYTQLPGDIGTGAENEPDPMSVGKESLKNFAEPAKSRRALEPKNVNFNPRSTVKKVVHDNVAAEKRKLSGRKKKEARNSRSRSSGLLKTAKEDVLISEDAPPFNGPVEISLNDQSQDGLSSENTPKLENGLDKQWHSEYQPTTTNSERQARGARPSRRSRGPINYAEPSLRGKMRRPTEDLVDAVAEHMTKRLSRSQYDHTDGLQNELQATKASVKTSLPKVNHVDAIGDKVLDLSTSSPEGKQSLEDNNCSSDNDTDTEREWLNKEQRARSMRAPTPDPSIRPVRQSRRNSSHPNYRLEVNSMAHIPV
ncbi:hypothetical protein McanMca71_007125 [Microsporum canis]|uniref:Shugoshin C terminal domain-containing protein n=1 Tax=Arthroderma otae (strain ATCC MYA-4605 / CBS 113480) TaxID=554155 RepID=C5FFD4_ARTOC|nr:shugoshin C terminal domain-containing protein [Microsporum canis CBS 113480]EEQ28518.1 shugoshin C terminal domain-containing protein [Microsporum canis CBS 113480]